MGKLFLEYLSSSKIYECRKCNSHLSSSEQLISKDFWAGQGKAFLYNHVVNYTTGPTNERLFRTGLHQVMDVYCKGCGTKVGWKYVWAREPEQKYKEGKLILEKNLLSKVECTIKQLKKQLIIQNCVIIRSFLGKSQSPKSLIYILNCWTTYNSDIMEIQSTSYCPACTSKTHLQCSSCHAKICHSCPWTHKCRGSSCACIARKQEFFGYFLVPICMECKDISQIWLNKVYDHSRDTQDASQMIGRLWEMFHLRVQRIEILSHDLKIARQQLQQETKNASEIDYFIINLQQKLIPDVLNILFDKRANIFIIDTNICSISQIIPKQDESRIQVLMLHNHSIGDILVSKEELRQQLLLLDNSLISDAIRIKILKQHSFTYMLQTHRMVSLSVAGLDPHMLVWAIKALEKHCILPFVHRIKDVFKGVFGVIATTSQIAKRFGQLRGQGFQKQFLDFDGRIKTCFCIDQSLALQQENRFTLLMSRGYGKFQQIIHTLDWESLEGTFTKAMFFSKILALKDSGFTNVYKYIQLVPKQGFKIKFDPPVNFKNEEKTPNKLEGKQRQNKIDSLESLFDNMLKLQPVEKKNSNFDIKNIQRESECPICFEEMKMSGIKLECRHTFHKKCIKQCLQSFRVNSLEEQCPSCRQKLSQKDLERIINHRAHFQESKNSRQQDRCLNPFCDMIVSEESKNHPCILCGNQHCWTCENSIQTCICIKKLVCDVCTLIIEPSSNQEFAHCEACENLMCVACKVSVGSCVHYQEGQQLQLDLGASRMYIVIINCQSNEQGYTNI